MSYDCKKLKDNILKNGCFERMNINKKRKGCLKFYLFQISQNYAFWILSNLKTFLKYQITEFNTFMCFNQFRRWTDLSTPLVNKN